MQQVSKSDIVHGMIWSAIEKYSSQGIAFLVSIVMARLLTPFEYGIIGVISVFISFSSIFINSGLTYALISKKECSKEDYCTANWINIGISLICYIILYFAAPYIAEFYDMPIIVPTLRIMNLCFIIGAISSVGRTILTKEMKFNELSVTTFLTSVFSGIIGIWMAYRGLGVWALVYQSVLSALFSSIWIMALAKFTPSLKFSHKSFNELLAFGSKILGSDIIWVVYQNMYPLIIGKMFNTQSIGYFNRASSYSQLVPANFSGILEKVLFPAFSNIQNDEDKLLRLYGKSLSISSFVIFTGCFFLMGLAYPLILNMISEKWLPCVPILQILCLRSLFGHINSINGRLLIVKGYPGIFMKMSVVNLPITIIIVSISWLWGIIGLTWGVVISSFIGTMYCCYIFKKSTGINPMDYLKDSFKILVIAGLVGSGAMLSFKYWLSPTISNLLLAAVLMTFLYLGCIKIIMPQILVELKNLRR